MIAINANHRFIVMMNLQVRCYYVKTKAVKKCDLVDSFLFCRLNEGDVKAGGTIR